MVSVLNAWSSIMPFNAVVRVVSSEIHCPVAHYHCNAVIHCVNAMNQDNIVRKAVALTRNAHADKCVRPENVEADAIQEIVWKVNCAKKELVLLAVEIIWIVRVTERV